MKKQIDELLTMLTELKTTVVENENDLNDIPFDPLVTDFETMIACTNDIKQQYESRPQTLDQVVISALAKQKVWERNDALAAIREKAKMFLASDNNIDNYAPVMLAILEQHLAEFEEEQKSGFDEGLYEEEETDQIRNLRAFIERVKQGQELPKEKILIEVRGGTVINKLSTTTNIDLRIIDHDNNTYSEERGFYETVTSEEFDRQLKAIQDSYSSPDIPAQAETVFKQYLSDDEERYPAIYKALRLALASDPDCFIDHVEIDDTDPLSTINVWEKVQLEFSVKEFCEMAGITANKTNPLPEDQIEWSEYDPKEAVEDGLIEEDQLMEGCEQVFVFDVPETTGRYWIQRVFNPQQRQHEYFTEAGRDSITGSFEDCVRLINKFIA